MGALRFLFAPELTRSLTGRGAVFGRAGPEDGSAP